MRPTIINGNNRLLFIRERDINPNGSINYGMAVIATIVSKKYEAKVIDNSSQYVIYSQNDILNMIAEFDPAVICFSIITLNALRSYKTIEIIKAHYGDIPIVAGGLHVSNVYKEALQHKIDFAVRGEADLVIIPLIDRLVLGDSLEEIKDNLDIQGVSYLRGNQLIDGGICPLPMDLDSCSFADYRLYNLNNFMKARRSKNLLYLITQRGCPFRCTFCSDQFGRAKVRYRSIDNAIENIEYLYDTFGMEVVNIGDANFTLSEQRVTDFCMSIINKGLNHKIKFLVQSDSYRLIEKDVLILMRESGFNTISFGIERLEEETQKKIGKRLTKDIILENISNASRVGFVTQVNYIIGFHFENERLIERENRNFLELFEKGADIITTNILNPMPGTEEYESNKDVLDRWYLNPAFLDTYRPIYLISKNLIYDPLLINIYSFDQNLVKKMIAAKVLFRSQSIKKKNYIFYIMYRILLIFSYFSEKLYRNNIKSLERKLFGKFPALLYQFKVILVINWAKWRKAPPHKT